MTYNTFIYPYMVINYMGALLVNETALLTMGCIFNTSIHLIGQLRHSIVQRRILHTNNILLLITYITSILMKISIYFDTATEILNLKYANNVCLLF